jgi:hypothetical protein
VSLRSQRDARGLSEFVLHIYANHVVEMVVSESSRRHSDGRQDCHGSSDAEDSAAAIALGIERSTTHSNFFQSSRVVWSPCLAREFLHLPRCQVGGQVRRDTCEAGRYQELPQTMPELVPNPVARLPGQPGRCRHYVTVRCTSDKTGRRGASYSQSRLHPQRAPPRQRSTLRRQSGCAVALYRGPVDNAWYSAAICIGWIAVLQFRCKSVSGAAMPRNSWYSCGRETK